MQSNYTLTYIFGSGHCGSTLLNLLLNGHSNITGLSEVDNLPEARYEAKYEKRFATDFWQDVIDCFETHSSKPFDDIEVSYPDWSTLRTWSDSRIRDWNRDNKVLFNCVSRVSGSDYVVDSSKWHQRLNLLSRSDSHNLKILHLVRDGRAVINSYLRKYGSFTRAFRRWFVPTLLAFYYRRSFSAGNWKTIRYENLSRNPEIVLQDVCAFLDLEYEAQMLEFRSHPYYGLGGNRMVEDDEEVIEPDTRWENELAGKDRLLFACFGGWLNRLYGYQCYG